MDVIKPQQEEVKHRCTGSLRAAGTCRMMETSWRVGCAIDYIEICDLDYAKISPADLDCRVALSGVRLLSKTVMT